LELLRDLAEAVNQALSGCLSEICAELDFIPSTDFASAIITAS